MLEKKFLASVETQKIGQRKKCSCNASASTPDVIYIIYINWQHECCFSFETVSYNTNHFLTKKVLDSTHCIGKHGGAKFFLSGLGGERKQ